MSRETILDMAVRATAKRLCFSRRRLAIRAERGFVLASELAMIRDYFGRLSDLLAEDAPVHG